LLKVAISSIASLTRRKWIIARLSVMPRTVRLPV